MRRFSRTLADHCVKAGNETGLPVGLKSLTPTLDGALRSTFERCFPDWPTIIDATHFTAKPQTEPMLGH